jgi:hypothetical protein
MNKFETLVEWLKDELEQLSRDARQSWNGPSYYEFIEGKRHSLENALEFAESLNDPKEEE